MKPIESEPAPFESLMSKFEGKSLQEQLTILNRLDKQKIDEAHKRMFVAEESVPDTRKASILNKLLSEHFPACDLQKQMEAFTALPIPQMIDDFRSVRRDSGNDGCCRPVLCHYLRYLHPTLYDLVVSLVLLPLQALANEEDNTTTTTTQLVINTIHTHPNTTTLPTLSCHQRCITHRDCIAVLCWLYRMKASYH